MSLFDVFNLSGSALSAQNVRLGTIANNLANAESISTTPEGTYKAQAPIFRAVYDEFADVNKVAVKVVGIAEDTTPPQRRYEPGNPLANPEGFIYMSNVNAVEEMSNMMAASRSFQINIEMMNNSKELLLRTLTIGQ
jgi:flagellar basal-body rod protein FlgC